MSRKMTALVALIALAVTLASILPGAPPSAAQPLPCPPNCPSGPPFGDEPGPLYSRGYVVLDVLPVAVIYEPPGPDAYQRLTITNRFATRTTATEMQTENRRTTIGVEFSFASGSSTQEETWTSTQQQTSWETQIETAGWETRAKAFPGDGDLIVFYLRPRFELELKIGYGTRLPLRFEEVYNPPIFSSMEPERDEVPPANPADRTWVKRAATVREIATRTGNAQDLDERTAQKLLRLDPFAYRYLTSQPSEFLLRLGDPRRRPATSPSSATDPGHPNIPDTPRFVFQQDYIDWAPCGSWHDVGQGVELGHSTSVIRTYRHMAHLVGTLSPEISTPIGPVTPSVTLETTFTFDYSVNRMTEEVGATEAQARVGGGPPQCVGDEPLFATERWYDTAFGTQFFPTYPVLEAANVEGTTEGDNASGQYIVAEDADGERTITLTDASGRFRLYLQPGRYTVSVQDRQRRALSQRLTFTVPAQGVLRLDALRLTGAIAEREAPLATPTSVARPRLPGGEVVAPTTTPTSRLRLPDREIEVPTATPASRLGLPDRQIEVPTATPASRLGLPDRQIEAPTATSTPRRQLLFDIR